MKEFFEQIEAADEDELLEMRDELLEIMDETCNDEEYAEAELKLSIVDDELLEG